MSLNAAAEKAALDELAWTGYDVLHNFIYDAGLRAFGSKIKPGRALELGAGTGDFSRKFLTRCEALDTIEGSHAMATRLREKHYPRHRVIEALFEEFKPERQYRAVFASFVNEHVADPAVVYRIAKDALLPDGHLFIIVPNRQALSRQLAQAMGILERLDELTPNDHRAGHRRTYDIGDLRAEVAGNGFVLEQSGGLMLKPFADFQLNQLLNESFLTTDHLGGLEKLGQAYPELCMSLYAVARPRED
jgi:SAM-dependent methyltransferase